MRSRATASALCECSKRLRRARSDLQPSSSSTSSPRSAYTWRDLNPMGGAGASRVYVRPLTGSARAHLDTKPVGIQEKRGVVVRVVVGPRSWRMENLRARLHRRLVHPVDVPTVGHREGQVMEAGRVELERLLRLGSRRLPQAERAAAVAGEAHVVDRLTALALEGHRRREAELAQHREVEGDRAVDVAADQIHVREPVEHAVYRL